MNIGFKMGGGVVVLDKDPRNGGDESLRRLEAEYGPLPRTPKVITGGGGEHYYFLEPTGMKKGLIAPGIDFQAEGSQVLAPPSLHASGQCYRWELAPTGIEAGVEQVPFAMLPAWVKGLMAGASGERPGAASEGSVPRASSTAFLLPPASISEAEGVGEGLRHAELLRLVGRELSRGHDVHEVLATALEWNERNEPPLPEKEVERQVVALAKKEERKAVQHPLPPLPVKPGGRVEGGMLPSSPAQDSTFHLPPPENENGEAEEQGEKGCVVQPQASGLHPDAYHGLLGNIAQAVAPETEADEAAILISLLVAVGNAIGPDAHAQVGGDRHGPNTFALLVGPTTARKGASESIISWLMERAVPSWAKACISYGLGTGEGLTERLQDGSFEEDKNGVLTFVNGTSDKRLLAIEREFASILKKGRREGNTLPDVIRNAFDGKPLEVINRRKNSLKATGHHVSIIGHITHEELAGELKGSEVANGFLNRFLLVAVARSKKLPSGGNITVLEPFIKPLASALEAVRPLAGASGQKARLLNRTQEAEEAWAEWYCSHAEYEGTLGKVTARAEAHALRLSLIYALVDGAVAIGIEHLRAGLAVWAYCERSAMLIFGKGEGTTPPSPPSLSEKLLQAIDIKPGILKTELWSVVGHKVKAVELADALTGLEASGRAHRKLEGRGERWYPGEGGTVEGGRVEGGMFTAQDSTSGNGGRVEGGMFTAQDSTSGNGGRVEGGMFTAQDSTFHLPPDLPPGKAHAQDSTFHLPPDLPPGKAHAQDSTFHLPPGFVEELASSRPAPNCTISKSAPLTGGEGGVVPPLADADAVIREVYSHGGKIMKTPTGGLTVKVWDWPLPWPEGQPLPTVPNAEQVEAVANRQAVADALLTEEEFEAEIREM